MNGGPQSLEWGIAFLCREEGALNCMKAPLSFFPSCKTTLALELRCWLFPRVLLKPFLQTKQGKVVEDAARRTGIRENLPFLAAQRCASHPRSAVHFTGQPWFRSFQLSGLFMSYTSLGLTTSFCRD